MHGINGIFVIPALALLLLIVSFFTKVRGAIKWAAIVFVLVVVQGQLGTWAMTSRWRVPARLNALALFGVAPMPVVGYGPHRLLLSSQSAYRRPGVMACRSRPRPPGTPRGLRFALPIVATLAIVAPLAWLWQDSWVPGVYSVMDMGYLDYGGGLCLIQASVGMLP